MVEKALAVLAWLALAAPVAAQVESAGLADLEAAVRRDSNDAQLHYALGVALAKSGRREEAQRSSLKPVGASRGSGGPP